MNKNIVVTADEYDRIDGKYAGDSDIKRLTLGQMTQKDNKTQDMVATIWKQVDNQSLEALTELPVHQVLDMTILLCKALAYFQEAYRFPLLYNPSNPLIERIGLQGGAMPVSICMDNPNLNKDIQDFLQSINNSGECIGERLRVLTSILEEMGY